MLTAALAVCMSAAVFTGCGGGGDKAADTKTLKIGVTNFAD